ncbi:efflux RND transporter periplasmic adaptor subunit [Thermanaeromonas sp. C210]|uniref:efflux RND transporter periplasmic adaptor subunit n=1 Tax=Thermanaeromonas sp. C210 TaxID=2731925 RepID=UPI00155CF8A9|nr:efflux RND transporter periplasmic adaptor subunit [Thermanaeromonas sp. C210]GFN21770.1 secretion protein HlyD [Thermanaeromonas sp. C210]
MTWGRNTLRHIAYINLLVFLAAFLLAGCGRGSVPEAQEARVAVALGRAERGEVVKEASTTGTIQGAEEINVVALATGRIADVYVQVGDRVRKGDLIAELENDDIRARLDQARAGLEQVRAAREQLQAAREQAQAGLRQAEANAATAEANLERMKSLFEAGAVSQQQLEQAQTAWEVSQAQVEAARASLKSVEAQLAGTEAQAASAEAGVRQAEVALENTYVRAPRDGVISARLLEPGEIAQGPIVVLVADERLEVAFQVTEQDIVYLKQGQEIRVEVPAAGAEVKGTITSVSPAADQRTRTYAVKAALQTEKEGIKPGMTATVYYPTLRAENVVVVPKNAVINRDGQDIVYTVEDGRAVGRPVKTGVADGSRVEIKEGLSEGEAIVVKGQDFLSEGQPVEVVDEGAQG